MQRTFLEPALVQAMGRSSFEFEDERIVSFRPDAEDVFCTDILPERA